MVELRMILLDSDHRMVGGLDVGNSVRIVPSTYLCLHVKLMLLKRKQNRVW